MPVMDTGLWIVVAIIASALTFVSFKVLGKASVAFNMIAMALFMGLVIIHASGFEISSTTIYNDTSNVWTETDTFISGGTNSNWLSWVFLTFAIGNLGIIFMRVTKL